MDLSLLLASEGFRLIVIMTFVVMTTVSVRFSHLALLTLNLTKTPFGHDCVLNLFGVYDNQTTCLDDEKFCENMPQTDLAVTCTSPPTNPFSSPDTPDQYIILVSLLLSVFIIASSFLAHYQKKRMTTPNF
jgi:hypothetical protein